MTTYATSKFQCSYITKVNFSLKLHVFHNLVKVGSSEGGACFLFMVATLEPRLAEAPTCRTLFILVTEKEGTVEVSRSSSYFSQEVLPAQFI